MSEPNSGLFLVVNGKTILIENMTDEELERQLELCSKTKYKLFIRKLIELIRIMKYKDKP